MQGPERERFNEIKKELSKLSTKFSNNVLDATKAFKKLIREKALVDGLPDSALGLAAQQAKAAGHEDATPESGPWLITLDFPSYFPVMSHAKDRYRLAGLSTTNVAMMEMSSDIALCTRYCGMTDSFASQQLLRRTLHCIRQHDVKQLIISTRGMLLRHAWHKPASKACAFVRAN